MGKPCRALLRSICVTEILCGEFMEHISGIVDEHVPWTGYDQYGGSAYRITSEARQYLKERVQWPVWAQMQEDIHA